MTTSTPVAIWLQLEPSYVLRSVTIDRDAKILDDLECECCGKKIDNNVFVEATYTDGTQSAEFVDLGHVVVADLRSDEIGDDVYTLTVCDSCADDFESLRDASRDLPTIAPTFGEAA